MLKHVFLDHVNGFSSSGCTEIDGFLMNSEDISKLMPEKKSSCTEIYRFLMKQFCEDISKTDPEYASLTVTIDV